MVKVLSRLMCAHVIVMALLQASEASADTVNPLQASSVPPQEQPGAESGQVVRQLPLRPDRDNGATNAPTTTRHRYVGATFDVGFPDGAIVGVAARPLKWLRLGLGAGTNSISPGIRGSLTLLPLGVGPSLTVEGGHYFDGNANQTVSAFAGSSYDGNGIAKQFGYQYANFHLGLDLGRERFTFFFHGGMSYIHSVIHNANDTFGGSAASADGATTSVVVNGSPSISAWVPSLKLGFIFYVV